MTGMTEYEEQGATRSGALELAAARVVNSVNNLMSRAVTASGKAKKDIAESMQVSPGRITQILGAKGNVKISTLARFLDSCGYELKISAEPKVAELPSIASRTRGRRPERSEPPELRNHSGCSFENVTTLAIDSLFGGALDEFHNLRPSAASTSNHAVAFYLKADGPAYEHFSPPKYPALAERLYGRKPVSH